LRQRTERPKETLLVISYTLLGKGAGFAPGEKVPSAESVRTLLVICYTVLAKEPEPDKT